MSRLLEFVSLLIGGRKGGVRTRKATKHGPNPTFSDRNGSGLSFYKQGRRERQAFGAKAGSLCSLGIGSKSMYTLPSIGFKRQIQFRAALVFFAVAALARSVKTALSKNEFPRCFRSIRKPCTCSYWLLDCFLNLPSFHALKNWPQARGLKIFIGGTCPM